MGDQLSLLAVPLPDFLEGPAPSVDDVARALQKDSAEKAPDGAPHALGPSCDPPTDEAGAEKDGAASGPPVPTFPESGAAPSSDLSDLTDAIEAALASERMALTCCAEGEEHRRLRWSALYHWRGAEMHWLESLVCLIREVTK